jgi:hypothetical protein
MAQTTKVSAPKISLLDFVNNLPELAAGRVELIGAFVHWMENEKKITQDTEANFRASLEEFKTMPVK